ncbi:MAG: response regulator [Candidatus Omnitrophota bacterium]
MSLAKVLVVDDQEVIRELFVRILGAKGYDVSTAVDGLEALEKIKAGKFDVLLVDLKMPRMGGMELLREIKKLEIKLVSIVVTGYGTSELAQEAFQLGCFDYIRKPFDAEDVEAIIRRAVKV